MSAGSISLRLYPHPELGATGIVDELQAQAARAAAAGFDGVMTSEHHGGFAGYLPNPVQAAGWALEAMDAAGDHRPGPPRARCCSRCGRPSLVIEELAWLAARFAGRVGLGVAAGSLVDDFAIMGLTKDDLTARFTTAFATVADALSGRDAGPLAGDVGGGRLPPGAGAGGGRGHEPRRGRSGRRARSRDPARLAVGAGAGPDAGRRLPPGRRHRRGRAHPAGVDRSTPDRAGGPPGRALPRLRRTRGPGPLDRRPAGDRSRRRRRWPTGCAAVLEATGADACNLRVHAAGVAAEAVRDQIDALADVATRLRP